MLDTWTFAWKGWQFQVCSQWKVSCWQFSWVPCPLLVTCEWSASHSYFCHNICIFLSLSASQSRSFRVVDPSRFQPKGWCSWSHIIEFLDFANQGATLRRYDMLRLCLQLFSNCPNDAFADSQHQVGDGVSPLWKLLTRHLKESEPKASVQFLFTFPR